MKVYRLSSEEQWKKGILIDVDTYRVHTNGEINGPYKEADHHLTYSSTYFGEFISELKKINYGF